MPVPKVIFNKDKFENQECRRKDTTQCFGPGAMRSQFPPFVG